MLLNPDVLPRAWLPGYRLGLSCIVTNAVAAHTQARCHVALAVRCACLLLWHIWKGLSDRVISLVTS